MTEFLIGNGYTALFILSFLAATVLPLGSEWLLVALLLVPLDPLTLIVVATTGNVLGACTTYGLGRLGENYFFEKMLGIGEIQKSRAEKMYHRYGSWTLLLSWVPIIGDPLCLASGVFRTRFSIFLLLVLIGKSARYASIQYLTLQVAS